MKPYAGIKTDKSVWGIDEFLTPLRTPVIEACPRKCWSRRVSIPLAARAYPVEWRSNVDVGRERQPSGFPSPFDHASNAHPTERLPALIDENVSGLDSVGL